MGFRKSPGRFTVLAAALEVAPGLSIGARERKKNTPPLSRARADQAHGGVGVCSLSGVHSARE